MFASLVVLHVSLVPHPAPSSTSDLERERLAQVVRAVGREATAREGVPGVAIAVLRDGELAAECAFGSASTEAGGAVTAATRFDTGSLTRQFTAVAVLQLAAREEFALDDEVARHLPGFPKDQGSPTIRQLLAHRSGVPGWERVLAKHPEAATRELDETAFLGLFADVPFAFAPGDDVSQDTLGYALLALLVEKRAPGGAAAWMRAEVVERAGLASTDVCPEEGRPAGYAEDCKAAGGSLEIALPGAPPSVRRTLCSTARDVALWQHALFAGAVLDDADLTTFLAPNGSRKGPEELGAGLRTTKLEGLVRHAHSGGTKGFRVAAAHYPASSISIAVLTNCATADVDRMEEEIARVAHGLAPSRGEFPLLPEEVQRLPGAYQLATTHVRIVSRDGHLWFEEPGSAAIHLRSRGRGEFTLEGERDARVVFDLEAERAAWFALTRGGATSRAIRME